MFPKFSCWNRSFFLHFMILKRVMLIRCRLPCFKTVYVNGRLKMHSKAFLCCPIPHRQNLCCITIFNIIHTATKTHASASTKSSSYLRMIKNHIKFNTLKKCILKHSVFRCFLLLMEQLDRITDKSFYTYSSYIQELWRLSQRAVVDTPHVGHDQNPGLSF